jgi:sulfite reductase (ferredoxin)
MGDRESIGDMLSGVEELADRVDELFRSLDARLKFRISPIEEIAGAAEGQSQTHEIDLLGVACPLNFVKAKLALEKIEVGEVLEVLLDDGEPVQNVPDSFAGQGHEVVAIDKVDGHFAVKVRRKQ